MRVSRFVLGLVPLLITAACDSPDPVAVVTADRAVRIQGPAFLDGAGAYSWEAVVAGGGESDDYEWRVTWLDSDDPAITSRGRVLTLAIDRDHARFELELMVLSGGAVHRATALVNDCARPPFDDSLIDACSG
jgi:hypothetical protein